MYEKVATVMASIEETVSLGQGERSPSRQGLLFSHEIYTIFVRPVIEYAAVVYGSLLTEESSNKLEQLQKRALKMIYGQKTSYSKCLELSGIATLKAKRYCQIVIASSSWH